MTGTTRLQSGDAALDGQQQPGPTTKIRAGQGIVRVISEISGGVLA